MVIIPRDFNLKLPLSLPSKKKDEMHCEVEYCVEEVGSDAFEELLQ